MGDSQTKKNSLSYIQIHEYKRGGHEPSGNAFSETHIYRTSGVYLCWLRKHSIGKFGHDL